VQFTREVGAVESDLFLDDRGAPAFSWNEIPMT